MKTHSLAIIAGFAVVFVASNLHNVAAECANGQDGLISCSKVDFSAAINKIIFEDSERPLISISGTPGKILGLTVLDGLGHQRLSDSITIGPNGTTTYSFNASSYQLGIYRAILTDNTGKVILNFPVALQSSGPIRFHTDKDHYNAGDAITVSGSATPSKYVQILLIDPNLDILYKNGTHSNPAGHFAFKLSLPQFVKSGYWRIRATSESNFMILPLAVGNAEDAADLVSIPPYTYKPGTPLQQTRSGINSGDVLCIPDLQLVQSKQGVPACVRPQNAQMLTVRGWTTPVYNPATAGTVTNLSAFKLNLSTDSDMIYSGQKIGIDISFNNTSPIPLKLMTQDSRPYPGLSLGEECGFRSPIGIAILQGYYTEQNMTEGKALPIFDYMYYSVSCAAGVSSTQSYVFEPASSHAYAIPCDSGGNELPSCGGFRNEASHLKVNGTWPGGKFQPFEAGVYTIIGGDEWGHLAIRHFVVSNSTIFAGNLGAISCPAVYGGVQFGADVKNSTGFTNYWNSTRYGSSVLVLHPGMQGTISVQYSSPASAAWFQNNGNGPYNMTDGAAIFYMANATEARSVISYAASIYNDNTGRHTHICHYGTTFSGGFAEPCDTDNRGDIPPSELPYASKLLHVGIDTSFEPGSVMLYPDSNPVFTARVSASPDASTGVYWLVLGRDLCGPAVLAKLVVLP